MKPLEKCAEELNVILEELCEANGIVSVSEDFVDELFHNYIYFRMKVLMLVLFYAFVICLLIVYLLGSETLELPSWCKIIFSLALLRLIPVIGHSVRSQMNEKLAAELYELFIKNPKEWKRSDSHGRN